MLFRSAHAPTGGPHMCGPGNATCGVASEWRMRHSANPRTRGFPYTLERAEGQADRGRRERSVLCTRASEDKGPRRPSARSPAVVGEGLVGLRHAVNVVLALVRAALLGLRVHELVGEALGHGLLTPLAGELDEPAHGERARAPGGHLDGYLVGGAADPSRADLERGRERLDGRVERLDGVFVAALGDERERVVDDPLGGGLLAVEHDLVDHLLDQLRAVDGVRLDGADLGGCAAGHLVDHPYFFFTPYCERAFLRSLTPAASSVPRTTL